MISENVKILVAEDNEISRKTLMTILKKIGCESVVQTIDGAAAWHAIREALEQRQPFDIVISDWKMPNIDGISLVKKVRQHEETHNLPFILLTGVNAKELILEAIQAGVSTYITKPFAPEVFERKINEILSSRKNRPKPAKSA